MTSTADIVAAAMKYKGARYVFGGTPGPGPGPGPWDCSSFVNAVIGRDLGMAIPGYAAGTYHGQAHGPVVLSWAAWSGARTLPAGQRPSPGDLCVFAGVGATGHMGIALAANQMISALDTQDGVIVTPINGYGPVGAPLTFRRLTGATLSASASGTGGAAGGAGDVVVPVLLGLAVPALMVGAVAGAAILLGLVGAAAIGLLASRAAAG